MMSLSIPTIAGREQYASGRWPIFMQRVVRNGEVYSHNHDFMEIVFIMSGNGVHHSLHGATPVTSGHGFILRPGAWHAYRDCKKLEIINCAFSVEILHRELAAFVHEPPINYLFFTGPLSFGRRGVLSFNLNAYQLRRCRRYLTAMLKVCKHDTALNRTSWAGNFLLLLSALAMDIESETDASFTHIAPLHEAVQLVVQLFEENPQRNWTLNELAHRVHLDSSYLARLFKSNTGVPPLTYLARYRAEKAATLLLRSDDSISAIGATVGWDDPSYFSQRFKIHFGLNPREYRARFSHRTLPSSA